MTEFQDGWKEGYDTASRDYQGLIGPLLEVVHALRRWEVYPDHFWGTTPDTGLEVGVALNALAQAASDPP